jgi:hypothetical protein
MSNTEPDTRTSAGGLSDYKRRREAGEVALADWYVRLADLMTFGTDCARAKRLGLPLNEALTLEQAADVLDVRRRNCRQVFRLPAFRALLTARIGELRDAGKARAVARMVSLIDERGENTAADRSVMLKASQAVLGDESKAPVVNVGVQLGVAVKAGYVIRLPAQSPTPKIVEGVAEAAPRERPEHPSFAYHRRLEHERREEDARQREAERRKLDPVFVHPALR